MTSRGPEAIEAQMATQQPSPAPGIDAARRGPVMGARFAVAADHPLTSLTAMNVLQSGGNAIDATIAAAAVNVVTKPNRTHLGGDAFALIWHRRTGKVECLNAGGRAPLSATPEVFPNGIPATGPRASTVPGLVDSWVELHRRYAGRSLAASLEPAIGFCMDGFPASLHLSTAMASIPAGVDTGPFRSPAGRPYAPGETFRQPELAETFRAIAGEGREGFYGGRVGSAIAERMRQAGGLLTLNDLAEPTARWERPLSASYRGQAMFEQALPSQGLILLEALKVVERFPVPEWGLNDVRSAHVMVEATRLAFADIRRHVGDPDRVEVPVEWLLSDEHADKLARGIDLDRATAGAAVPISSDTTSFVVADPEMAVCYIQSVFSPWGSHFVIPGTGILMNNRMTGFHLDPASPNCLAPGKRTVHTLNNFLVVKDGRLVVGGGTPGADFQVQTNLQVITGVVDWGLDLQSAVDSPRWATSGNGSLSAESRLSPGMIEGLRSHGHVVQDMGPWGVRACSQLVASLIPSGWAVASDLRGEGLALAI